MKGKLIQNNRYIWDGILYFCLGCLSYFLLVRYADIPLRSQDKLMELQAVGAVVVLFIGVGLSIRWIVERLQGYYQSFLRNRRMLVVSLIVAAVLLFGCNYLLLVFAKWLVGVKQIFALHLSGTLAIVGVWLLEMIIVSLFVFSRFYVDLVRLYKHTEELEQASLKARYQALQSQLNPHFLFNCLNTLVAEIEYDPASAVEFTRNLSDTYRYILYCQNRHTVALSEELAFVDTYVQLHKVRLGECLTVDNQIPESYLDVMLPPLSLQLLVENVIKHNVVSMGKPMTITLAIETDDAGCRLAVSNPLRPKQGAVSVGSGLENLNQRYLLFCDKPIVVERTDNQFIVKLPLEII